MSNDAYVEFNGREFINLSRTAQLAVTLGVPAVWQRPAGVAWVQTNLAGVDYHDITEAPWYDAGYPESTEFAGFVPLSIRGLDDSTIEASTIEYIDDGGKSGKPRAATLPLVFSVILAASTERGAEYGLRWMKQLLRSASTGLSCSGADLRYFRTGTVGAPLMHRRDVALTRAPSVTAKRAGSCSATWTTTFTLTANDPYEYGEPVSQITSLGGAVATGPAVLTQGSIDLAEEECPVYDYTPIYDPTYPALVPSPTAPNFYPEGWTIEPGLGFRRKWVRLSPFEPSPLPVVPLITLAGTVDARMIRVSIWPDEALANDQCGALFSVVVSYMPEDIDFYIDGEQRVSFVWDGFTPSIRRTDSLTYAPDGTPVEWTSFNDPDGLMVTLDTFEKTGGGYEGDGTVRAEVSFIPKSD